MKAKCYYCNKELTEKTIKRHMKNCSEMKKSIEKKSVEDKNQRNQFIIDIKLKYAGNEYCIYLSIDETLGLVHIDQFIRDIWVECCGHLSGFKIRGKYYQDKEMNTQLKDILNIGEKFEYEYDFGSTTYLILEVVDIIQVSCGFSQIEIIARNNEIRHECESCGATAKYFNYEKDEWQCENCSDKDDDMICEFDYCNSPRDGVCGYQGHKEAENIYLPGNNKKYKLSKKNIKRQYDYEKNFNYNDVLLDDLLSVSGSRNSINSIFTKGIYSFDIRELINNLSKDNIYDIAKYLGMTKISSLNKGRLVEKLLNEYEVLIEERMSLFDEERYKFLKSYSDNGGVKTFKEIDEDNLEKIWYFLQTGMLFSANKDGKLVILIPEVIQKLIKEKNNIQYRNMIKLNSEIVSLYRGMNKAYGLLKLKDIEEIFKRYGIEESERYRIKDVIEKAEDYYGEYEVQETLFINNYIEDWSDLLEKIQTKTNVDYTIISKEELLSMSDENWISKTEFGKSFSNEFLSMFNIDKDILDGLIESLSLDIQENELDDIIRDMLEQLEDGDRGIQDFMCNSLDKFLTSIRLWKYKGATINEKRGNIINKEKQESGGRNEPCQCGSGKKYKNCCAKDGNVIKLF